LKMPFQDGSQDLVFDPRSLFKFKLKFKFKFKGSTNREKTENFNCGAHFEQYKFWPKEGSSEKVTKTKF
jgi:hypothetical protein